MFTMLVIGVNLAAVGVCVMSLRNSAKHLEWLTGPATVRIMGQEWVDAKATISRRFVLVIKALLALNGGLALGNLLRLIWPVT